MFGLMKKDWYFYLGYLALVLLQMLYWHTTRMQLDTTVVFMLTGWIYIVILGSIFGVEMNETKHRGYTFIATLPVTAREIVAAKLLPIFIMTVIYLIATYYSFSSLEVTPEYLAMARKWLLFNGALALGVAGLTYWVIFRYGSQKAIYLQARQVNGERVPDPGWRGSLLCLLPSFGEDVRGGGPGMNITMKMTGKALIIAAMLVVQFTGCGSIYVGGSGIGVGVSTGANETRPEKEDLPEDERRLTKQDKKLNLKSFDYVWAQIHENLWPELLEEAEWDEAYGEFRPRIEEASTMREWRIAMSEMLDRLQISHTQIIPGELYSRHLSDGTYSERNNGETGLSVRVLDGRAVVTVVHEESAAWADGVRPGWIVESLGGRNIEEGLAELAEVYEGHYMKDLTLTAVTQSRLSGDTGDDIEAVFLNGRDRQVEIDLILEPKRGFEFEYGNLPTMYVWIDTMTFAGDIEYVKFNMFMDPVHLMPVFERAVRRAVDGRGLVIDLRGNMGGMGAMASWLSGFLFDEKGHDFGTFRMKGTELTLIVVPRPNAYTGPVAVLIDGLSLSASEFMADGLQKTGRAKVFGQRTTGFALPSVIEKMPNGDAIQYVHADYVNSEGERLEGKGVTPDFQIIPARSQLLEGRDPVLEASIEWIKARAGSKEQ